MSERQIFRIDGGPSIPLNHLLVGYVGETPYAYDAHIMLKIKEKRNQDIISECVKVGGIIDTSIRTTDIHELFCPACGRFWKYYPSQAVPSSCPHCEVERKVN